MNYINYIIIIAQILLLSAVSGCGGSSKSASQLSGKEEDPSDLQNLPPEERARREALAEQWKREDAKKAADAAAAKARADAAAAKAAADAAAAKAAADAAAAKAAVDAAAAKAAADAAKKAAAAADAAKKAAAKKAEIIDIITKKTLNSANPLVFLDTRFSSEAKYIESKNSDAYKELETAYKPLKKFISNSLAFGLSLSTVEEVNEYVKKYKTYAVYKGNAEVKKYQDLDEEYKILEKIANPSLAQINRMADLQQKMLGMLSFQIAPGGPQLSEIIDLYASGGPTPGKVDKLYQELQEYGKARKDYVQWWKDNL